MSFQFLESSLLSFLVLQELLQEGFEFVKPRNDDIEPFFMQIARRAGLGQAHLEILSINAAPVSTSLSGPGGTGRIFGGIPCQPRVRTLSCTVL